MGEFYNLTPREIVAELDKYIVGQDGAKKSVAIALRNRHRRNQLSDEMREEVTPKNILIRGVRRGVGRNHPEVRSQARVKAEKRACGGQEPAVTAKAENAKMEQNRAGGKENHQSKGKKQEKINREIKACETFLHVQPTLGALLADLKEEKEPEGGAGVYE